MKRLWIIAATFVVSALMSRTPANAADITMTWTNVQDGFTSNFLGVWGNVTSPGNTAGEDINLYIRVGDPSVEFAIFTIQSNGDFDCIIEDPLDGNPSTIPWALLAWDQNGDYDGYGGVY